MEKIRTAVIGCGKVADAHAHSYQNIENAQLTAVCDVDERGQGHSRKNMVFVHIQASVR